VGSSEAEVGESDCEATADGGADDEQNGMVKMVLAKNGEDRHNRRVGLKLLKLGIE
jgi:hypothetical protein